MVLQKKSMNRLSKMYNNGSTPDLAVPPVERRAVSQQHTLPDRTTNPNAPWIPPQPHQRATSVQVPAKYLAPINTSQDFQRKPMPNDSSRRAVSASSSPINAKPNYSNQTLSANPARYAAVPHPTQTLPVPGQLAEPPSAKTKRKSWFGGNGTKLSKGGKGEQQKAPGAWILGHGDQRPAYDTAPLLNARKVTELWDPAGDVFVYLFPKTSGHSPSFLVASSVFASSSVLTEMTYGKFHSFPGAGQSTAALAQAQRRQFSIDHTSRRPYSRGDASMSSASITDPSEDSLDSRNLDDLTESGPLHLYLPIALSADGGVAGKLTANDVDTLISARNLFAFLIGHSIVATERRPSIFSVFLKVADYLTRFGFSNLDGSTFGEVAHASFDSYIEELHLGDVRNSREATIECIVLGEKMRSPLLYNEAFVHGVGKWYEILDLKSPKFDMISSVTRIRMERAALDLDQRKRNIDLKLDDFDFPAIFSGIMNSKTAHESKQVRFDEWRNSFMSTRRWFMHYYRQKYGAWPPKAGSKKNIFETSGLNRLVLKDLYHDLSNLYDLLVDRQSLTTRTTDMVMEDDDTEDKDGPMQRALRKVLNEYDRSTPPVQPPIPFDTPIIPTIRSVGDKKADFKLLSKKLKKDQLTKVLQDSYNKDSAISTPFLDSFREYEYHEAHNSTIRHLGDLRQGQWIFLYAVLQSLPMLVVDAPAVKWTQGVEYFLCEPPRSGVPWALETPAAYTYYAVAGGGGVVSLPSDVIEFGVEGIYRRSHCWEMAEKWTAHSEMLTAAVAETLQGQSLQETLAPPPSFGAPGPLAPRSRSSSPGSDREGRRSNRQSIMLMGLEALPMPGNLNIPNRPDSPILRGRGSPNLRPSTATGDPSKTFDAILGSIEQSTTGKKGKKK